MVPLAILAGLLFALACIAACGGTTTTAPTSVSSLSLTCPQLTLATGQQTQCTATFASTSGTSTDETSLAQWATSASTIVTVSSGGLVTGVSPGTAVVTATYQNLTGTRTFNVN
jgi:trimeric autotransporter adhesin